MDCPQLLSEEDAREPPRLARALRGAARGREARECALQAHKNLRAGGGVRLRYGAYGMELRYGATVWSVLRGTVGEEVWGNLIDPTEQQPPAHRGARSAVGRHERGVLALHPNGVCVSTCRRVSEISS